jgi:hypothetical protein
MESDQDQLDLAEAHEPLHGVTRQGQIVKWNRTAKLWQNVSGQVFPEVEVVQIIGKRIDRKLTVQDLAKFKDGPFMPTPHEGAEYGDDAALFDLLVNFFRKYSECPAEIIYTILAAFSVATWRVAHANNATYLDILAPQGSGKSKLLELLQWTCRNAIHSEGATKGALIRICDKTEATMLLDEAENWLDLRDFDNPLAAVLNSGYRRRAAGGVLICEPKGEGGKYQTVILDSFGFKAIASRNPLNDVLASRCIVIRMRKSTRKFPALDLNEAWDLRRKLVRYGEAHAEPLEHPSKDEIDEPRIAEVFEPLLAVAPSDEDRRRLLAFANEEVQQRKQEELASDEGQIARATVQLNNENTGIATLLIRDITDRLNMEITNLTEQFDRRTVARILRRLGFKIEHTRNGNAVIIKADLISYLAERYIPQEQQTEHGLDKYADREHGEHREHTEQEGQT